MLNSGNQMWGNKYVKALNAVFLEITWIGSINKAQRCFCVQHTTKKYTWNMSFTKT